MIEKIITIIFPFYGIFMYFIREECSHLLDWAILSIICYIIAFYNCELFIAAMIALIILSILNSK